MFAASRLLRGASGAARTFRTAIRQAHREFHGPSAAPASRLQMPLAVAVGLAGGAVLLSQPQAECAWYDSFFGWNKPTVAPVWTDVRAQVAKIIADTPSHGPLLVRLAWHASGTYDKASGTGGSNGATMRFPPECLHGANNGLGIARNLLEPIKNSHPEISYADLWTFAGAVAIEEMGGPVIPWSAGRTDAPDGTTCPPNGRLPDASKDAVHIRDIFYRMGFDDREIVALIGAHTLGFCHSDRSGYTGPWTRDPYGFDNSYYTLLLQEQWRVKMGVLPVQFEDSTGELMMLPADLALIIDPNLRKYVELYAKDSAAWEKDFAASFGRLLSLGVPAPSAK